MTEMLLKSYIDERMVNLQAALVVYDEIHYLRDKERGVVWEESIVLMPKSVRFAFLSATIPNAREFAEWIAKTHKYVAASSVLASPDLLALHLESSHRSIGDATARAGPCRSLDAIRRWVVASIEH